LEGESDNRVAIRSNDSSISNASGIRLKWSDRFSPARSHVKLNLFLALLTVALVAVWLSGVPTHLCVKLGRGVADCDGLTSGLMGVLVGSVVAWWASWAIAVRFARESTAELTRATDRLNKALDGSAQRVIDNLQAGIEHLHEQAAGVPGKTADAVESRAAITAIFSSVPIFISGLSKLGKLLGTANDVRVHTDTPKPTQLPK
jgi:hypothetical protein